MGTRYTCLTSITAVAAVLVTLAVVATCHIGRAAFYDESWVIDFARTPQLPDALARAMHDRQPVAVGYMAAMHTLARWAGGHRWVYRLPAVVAAAGLLVMIGSMTSRWCGVAAWGWAATLFVLACPLFQRYATEIKQYLPAAAVSLGLVLAADRWVDRPSRSAAMCWLILACVGILTGFSTWFAIAGTGLVVCAAWAIKRDRCQVTTTVAAGVVVAVLASVTHLLYNRHISGSDVLKDYWSDQYLSLDWGLAVSGWRMGVEFFEQSWYRYAVPGHVMMAMAVAGWFAWYRCQRVAAVSAAAVVACTVAANLGGFWPLGVRVNLPLVVMAHVCLLAGPLVFMGWGWAKWSGRRVGDKLDAPRPTDDATANPGGHAVVSWVGVAVGVVLSVGVMYETRGAEYETAAIDQLLGELARVAGADDLVLMTPAALVNQQLGGDSIAGSIRLAPWPQEGKMLELYQPLIRGHEKGRVWFAAGHHNQPMQEKWEALGRGLSDRGRFERTWSGKMVALYCFSPVEWEEIKSFQPADTAATRSP